MADTFAAGRSILDNFVFSMLPNLNQFILPRKKGFVLEVEPLRFVKSKVTEGRSFCLA